MGPRLRVDVYEHSARRWTRHRWTLATLIAAIDRCRPRTRRGAAWTFCVTRDGGDLAISTLGPEAFCGQHGVWDAERRFRGAMLYRGLDLADVRRALIAFCAGQAPARCFQRHVGTFRRSRRGRQDWVLSAPRRR